MKRRSELKFFLIIISIVIMVGIGTYLLLNKLAPKNPPVCKFIGKVWRADVPTPERPEPIRGCFTYEEMYKLELETE